MNSLTMYLVYGLPGLVLLVCHVLRRRRLEKLSVKALEHTGAAEPASLHPVIDNTRCIGCSSCIKACPEQSHHTVLGIVGGHAVLVSPGDCIGHGACKTICPVDAIKLVFGSERRGVDIPILTPSFESTVPGVFVAGELGGMGLIRNALEQGRQAVEAIAQFVLEAEREVGAPCAAVFWLPTVERSVRGITVISFERRAEISRPG